MITYQYDILYKKVLPIFLGLEKLSLLSDKVLMPYIVSLKGYETPSFHKIDSQSEHLVKKALDTLSLSFVNKRILCLI